MEKLSSITRSLFSREKKPKTTSQIVEAAVKDLYLQLDIVSASDFRGLAKTLTPGVIEGRPPLTIKVIETEIMPPLENIESSFKELCDKFLEDMVQQHNLGEDELLQAFFELNNFLHRRGSLINALVCLELFRAVLRRKENNLPMDIN